ncbi:MAG TPA: hypothetical protein VGP82_06420 [Ktedonobacterales bacterium]|jgi:hypothetical protein|nr:hypothetical protein [Ktedonobacterales bacterium]
MSYTTYDFHETLFNSEVAGQIAPPDVKSVLAAWGGSPEGGGSWSGGFLLAMKDGRFAYITGWCDYTGWGCQDGARVTFYDSLPDRETLDVDDASGWDDGNTSWDEEPADLNRYIAGGYADADRWS